MSLPAIARGPHPIYVILMPRRNQPQDEELSPRLRHILRELERIIVGEGFRHLDTATLARRLRCSKRALYAFAPTQERLLQMLIRRVLERTDAYLAKAARDAPNPRAALTHYMSAIVETSRPASARFLRDIAAFPPGMRLLQQLQRRTCDRLERLIREGSKAGTFNDISPKLVAELILMAAGSLIDPGFQRSLGLNLAESYEELSRLLYHGLLPHQDLGRSNGATSLAIAGGAWEGMRPEGAAAQPAEESGAGASKQRGRRRGGNSKPRGDVRAPTRVRSAPKRK